MRIRTKQAAVTMAHCFAYGDPSVGIQHVSWDLDITKLLYEPTEFHKCDKEYREGIREAVKNLFIAANSEDFPPDVWFSDECPEEGCHKLKLNGKCPDFFCISNSEDNSND